MFPLREIPSLDEIRERGKKFGLLNPGAILAALRTLRVANDLMAVVEANFARLGTSAGRFSVLMLLHRTEGESLAPSELAQQAGVTRATITGLVDGLEREGLVQRQSHPDDRRRIKVALTGRGSAFLDDRLPQHARKITSLMRHLSEVEQMQLLGLLEKIEKGIDELDDV